MRLVSPIETVPTWGSHDRTVGRDLEAESGPTNDASRSDNHTITKIAMRQHRVCINAAVPANPDTLMDHRTGTDHRAPANFHIIPDNNSRANLNLWPVTAGMLPPDALTFGDNRGERGGEIAPRRITHQAHDPVRQRRTKGRRCHDDRTDKPWHVIPVLRPAQKCQGTLAGLGYRSGIRDRPVAITVKFTSGQLRQRSGCGRVYGKETVINGHAAPSLIRANGADSHLDARIPCALIQPAKNLIGQVKAWQKNQC